MGAKWPEEAAIFFKAPAAHPGKKLWQAFAVGLEFRRGQLRGERGIDAVGVMKF